MVKIKQVKYSKYSIILICSLFLTQLSAQQPERLATHFDKPFYVAGEDVWYKIYFLNEQEAIQSKVVRVEWVAPNGQLLLQQKLKVVGNYAVGDFAIPYDWQEGNYQFRAYTLWSQNFGEEQYCEKIIPIYNLQETPKEVPEQTTTKPISTTSYPLQITIQPPNKESKKKELVELTITVTNQNGQPTNANLSIAVTDGTYLPLLENQTILSSTARTSGTINANKYPVEKGIQLQGLLKDEKNSPLDTRFLSIYFPKTRTFQSAIIEDGQLAIQIPDFYTEQPVQLFDLNPFHAPLSNIQLENFQLAQPFNAPPLYRSEGVANYLFLLSKYRQYREAFLQATPDYGPTPRLGEKKKLEADIFWGMEKYAGLSDLASFASEIISEGRVVNEKGKRSIRLKYAEKRIFNRRSPWYLVNDWLTEDESIVLKMPFREIDKISMFNSKEKIATQLDPAMVSRGLLSITTKDGKIPEGILKKTNAIQLTGFYPIRSFPVLSDKSLAPDFRPVVYWNPTIETTAKGTATIRFKTSDSIGPYAIHIVGCDEQGNLGQGFSTYTVIFK